MTDDHYNNNDFFIRDTPNDNRWRFLFRRYQVRENASGWAIEQNSCVDENKIRRCIANAKKHLALIYWKNNRKAPTLIQSSAIK